LSKCEKKGKKRAHITGGRGSVENAKTKRGSRGLRSRKPIGRRKKRWKIANATALSVGLTVCERW